MPEELGGAEAGTVAYSLAMQELARGDASVAVAVSVTNMVAELIAAQRAAGARAERWVPRLVVGRARVAARSRCREPEAGSDPAAMRTTATKTATGWRLTGTKQWITSGDHAGVMVVWAVTEPGAGHKGITAFLVAGEATGPHGRAARGQAGPARLVDRAARARRRRGRRRRGARRGRAAASRSR